MSRTVIELENVSKYYRLGYIGGETLSDDMRMWWARVRGKENPLLKIGEKEISNQDGDYFWALRNINLKVEQGDILGIIGANGAGKSTLLKILSRITGPSTGKVKIKGRIGSLLEVGTGFHPELTGRENVYLNGAILGMRSKEIDQKFDEIVDFSGVENYIDTPVKRYSSGMRVRLGFAVAAHLDPEILVVDEVLAVGDAEFQKKCLGKMGSVADEGRTVLFVSHNMDSVLNLCNRGILLSQGIIKNEGDIEEIIFDYLSNEANAFEEKNEQLLSNIIREKDTYGNNIKLTKVNFVNHENNYSIWEPIILQIKFSVFHKLENINFRIIVKREDNSVAFVVNSNFYEQYSFDIGNYSLGVTIPSPNLPSGIYKIEILIRMTEIILDRVEKALYFKITNNSNFPIHAQKHGSLPISTWEIK